MNKELEFAKALEGIKELAKNQQNVISKEQVKEAFDAIGIEEEQLEPVYQYLKAKNIGIGESVEIEERLSSEEKDYLAEYEKELSLLPKLTEGQKRAYTMAAMAGDSEGKEQLLTHYLTQVVDLAKLYIGQGVFLEDLVGEGNLALATGIEMLGCLEEPEEAESMLGKMMMDAMEDYINENTRVKKADFELETKVNEIQDLAKELAESLEKKITVEELAKETGKSEEEILEAIRFSGNKIPYFED